MNNYAPNPLGERTEELRGSGSKERRKPVSQLRTLKKKKKARGKQNRSRIKIEMNLARRGFGKRVRGAGSPGPVWFDEVRKERREKWKK